jgi:hypothetical protein
MIAVPIQKFPLNGYSLRGDWKAVKLFPAERQVPGTFTSAEEQNRKNSWPKHYVLSKEVPGTFQKTGIH